MNKIFYYQGDAVHEFLTSTKYQIFIHGANCQATMNSGIARDVKSRIPELYHADLDMHIVKKPTEKLGSISFVTYQSEDSSIPHKMAFNLYTQLFYGTEKRHFNYGAFVSSLNEAITQVKSSGCMEVNNTFNNSINIVMPKIGCGLGGGNWDIVEELITHMKFSDVHLNFHVCIK